MKITKTWKQKTKLYSVAAVVGLAATLGGIGGLAAPASAETFDSVICYGDQQYLSAQKLIVLEMDLYYHAGCDGMVVWKETSWGSWKSRPYKYAADCDHNLNVTYVAEICGKQVALTLEDYLSKGDDGCFYDSANNFLLRNECSGKAYEGLVFSES